MKKLFQAIRKLFKSEPVQTTRMEAAPCRCHGCAQRLNDRAALYRLVYLTRGTNNCAECGHQFTVRLEPEPLPAT
jgi:hypothetical protein